MHVMGPRHWAPVGLVLAVSLPMLLGRSPERAFPPGGCRSPQSALENSQAGPAMVQQVLAAAMPWGEQTLNDYIARIGQNLARSSGSQHALAFFLVYNPAVNAWAFPGGYIVINSGVIGFAESEAELAFVLCLEIAHEYACECQRRPWKNGVFELARADPDAILPALLERAPGSDARLISTPVDARYRRAAEPRLDLQAAQYLVRAGYDPRLAALFFERLRAEAERRGAKPESLPATHRRASHAGSKRPGTIPSFASAPPAPPDEPEFIRMRQAVRKYDEVYARAVGISLPGREPFPPELSRRPPAPQNQGTR